MTGRESARSSTGGGRRLTWALSGLILLLALSAFVALVIRFWPYTIDDSYITFRYASNFAAGKGLVFNPGEQPRAEGITSPLYAIVLAVAPLTGINIVAFSKTMGLLACLAAAILIGGTIYRLTSALTHLEPASAFLVSASGAACFLTSPNVVGNALSGMETAPAAMAFSAFLFLLAGLPDARSFSAAAAALGVVAVLVPMLRPEMGLAVVIALAAAAAFSRSLRPAVLRALAVFIAAGVAYTLVRLCYYRLLFPLPFYKKQRLSDLPGAEDVKFYLEQVGWLVPLIGICLVFAIRRRHERPSFAISMIAATALAVLAQLLYYTSIRHVMGFGFRFFVPLTSAFLVLAFAGCAVLCEALADSRRLHSSSGVVSCFVIALLCVGGNALSYRASHHQFIDLYTTVERGVVRVARGMQLAAEDSMFRIALNDCGAIPFYTGFPIVDLAGLNNRVIALGSAPAAAQEEIRRNRSQLVILVSARKHDPTALHGWERLRHGDIVMLGYQLVGTMTVAEGYHLLVYRGDDPLVAPLLERLETAGILELLPG